MSLLSVKSIPILRTDKELLTVRQGHIVSLVSHIGAEHEVLDRSVLKGKNKGPVVWYGTSVPYRFIPPGESNSESDRDEEALFNITAHYGADPDAYKVKCVTSTGMHSDYSTLVRAIPKGGFEHLALSCKAMKHEAQGIYHWIDALGAGLHDHLRYEDRRVILLFGDKSFILLVQGSVVLYIKELDVQNNYAFSETEAVHTVKREIDHIFQRVDSDDQSDSQNITFVCPNDIGPYWSTVAESYERSAYTVHAEILNLSSDVLVQQLMLDGALALSKTKSKLNIQDLQQSNPEREGKSLLTYLAVSGLMLVGLIAGGKYFKSIESENVIHITQLEKEASTIRDRAELVKEKEAKEHQLEEKIVRANERKAAADKAGYTAGVGSTALSDAMDTFSRFSVSNTWLDGISARWGGRGETPALSAVGGAHSRPDAVNAASSLTGLGFGRWGAFNTGWQGQYWIFELSPPTQVSQDIASQATGALPNAPKHPVNSKSDWGPAGTLNTFVIDGMQKK